MITSKTSFIALIGNPVDHSLSPIMQNAALNYLNLDSVYLSIPCEDKDFELVINSLKKMNCIGLNITIPFKEKVFKLCAEISPLAQKIKAINTLKLNNDNEWIGTNTDVEGFKYPLKKYNLENKKSLVLGSGGAARSALQGLLDLKLSDIKIISRNKTSLGKLINDFQNESSIEGILIKDLDNTVIQNANLIVNTTPVGMKNLSNNLKELELPFGKCLWESINPKTIVYDLIYNPRETALLKYCAQKGCITLNGLEMLIAQGAKSLSFWTDVVDIPFQVMQDSLKSYL
tara:strand:- start:319 stop:1182 length:864 start_codon:yes stop_codon:yes gene_type:complete